MNLKKKIILAILLILVIATASFTWLLLGSGTNFSEDKKAIYIKTGSDFNNVMEEIDRQQIIKYPGIFSFVAKKLNYPKNIKPGKYVFKKGESIYSIIKTLRNGNQTPVSLVINKLRTKEDLAEKIAANFECDSTEIIQFLYNKDSLAKYNLDTNTVMTAIIPNTYNILWNSSAPKIFKKLWNEQEKFWNKERKQKAAALNLTPKQVYTLASIIEEETNKEEDKGKIASVYLNRLETGMELGADPTVKYAMRDFGLKRIMNKHLSYPSVYNTYQHLGLPPGPICTPSPKTIDAALNAPSTNYLYFVAQPNLTGYSNFASTYQQHLLYAKEYQKWISEYLKAKETK
ncbi:endolytic transglycosylase MltG [Ferruginibacter sp. SUN002]|uniref:endolytic transglycosylase MltG n=1 Tax=Ferruginibacter sp. SUN002 TaxID=2937789 RepID=UPI003D369078